ncbi:MAG: D-alanyl-D-alanine carboxypeptidase [Clostridia bacterium]|nr:D-alanyl-D-alanine carboxypeptidase [Clostridia bacterium]
MLKKLFAFVLVLCAIMGSMSTVTLAAGTVPAEVMAISTNNIVLYEANSRTVLYEKNGMNQAFPASTTKILTAIIVLDLCEGKFLLGDLNEYFNNPDWLDPEFATRTFSLDDEVTVTDPERRGSVLGISHGEKLTVRDLLYGMMLVSGNDCARALSIYFSPAIESKVVYFAEIMNAYAKELGATTSHFVVPHGLHDTSHMSSAYDLALITAYALKNNTFREVVATETYNIAPTNHHSEGFLVENTNRLIHMKADDEQDYKYEYAIGVKTGDTDAAGRCIVSAAEKDGKLLIAVLLGDFEQSKIGSPRYVNSKTLFEYGFNNFQLIKASEFGIEPHLNCNILDSDAGTVKLDVDLENALMCLRSDEIAEIKSKASILTAETFFNTPDGKLHAPLRAGEVVGYAKYMYNDQVVLTADLKAPSDLEQTDGTGITGITKSGESDDILTGYDWIFWVLLFCILLVIVLVIIALTKQPVRKRNSQLRRKSRR